MNVDYVQKAWSVSICVSNVDHKWPFAITLGLYVNSQSVSHCAHVESVTLIEWKWENKEKEIVQMGQKPLM